MSDCSGLVRFADVKPGDMFGYDFRFFIKTVGQVEGPNGGMFSAVYDVTLKAFDVWSEDMADQLVFPSNQLWFEQGCAFEDLRRGNGGGASVASEANR